MFHPVVCHLARLALRARALDFTTPAITIGTVTLLPHQTAAVHWLLHRIATLGGALLADPPGLGKTYVALAVAAARREKPLVIAPASLRSRWQEAARETGVVLDFVSTERLSAPGAPPTARHTLVIIDEAHHLRTPSTRRHLRTADLCRHSAVLLLSATPIHNRARDLEHITALFHLPPTRASAATLRRRLTLRRTLAQIEAASGEVAPAGAIPRIRVRRDMITTTRETFVPEAIMALPPLVDHRAEGHHLLQLGLLHALRSSDAAAKERIRRRIAVTLAIEHAARDSVEPTAQLKRAFQSHHGDVQLALTTLLAAHSDRIDPRLAGAAVRQREALEALLPQLSGAGDDTRAGALRRLARWSATPVVAFTQFNATAAAFHLRLRDRPGIAWLGATTAHIATGTIPRDEVLERLLSPRRRGRRDIVRLLITTDVLSEGLSLAGVATVVHLDLPWTPARIDQRIGRAARIGAPVTTVNVVTLLAQLPVTVHDAARSLLARKRRRMAVIDGAHDEETQTVRILRRICDRSLARSRRRGWVTMASAGLHGSLTIAEVQIARRRCLVAADAEGVRRPNRTDWETLARALPAAPGVHAIASLRRALREHVLDTSMTAIVSDPRDLRLESRRGADESLASASRVDRMLRVADVTNVRRAIMSTSPHQAETGARAGHCAAATSVRSQVPHGGAQREAILIRAGVTIVPQR